HGNCATCRSLHPGKNLHQRRLARAVLADQHIDRAGMNIEIHVLQGNRAGQGLGDGAGAEDEGTHGATSRLTGVTMIASPARLTATAPVKVTTSPTTTASALCWIPE